jgi:hypothetical protein
MGELLSAGELLSSQAGRDLLEEAGLFTDADSFAATLRPPLDMRLHELLGLDRNGEDVARPVCFGHQISCDYRRSVARKFAAARELAARPPIAPVFVPVDTDRAGADPSSVRVQWGEGTAAPFSTRLVSNKLRSMETRFVPVDEVRLPELLGDAARWFRKTSGVAPERWEPRLERLAEALSDSEIRTLAQANLTVTRVLLHDHVRYDPPCLLLSELAALGFMTTLLTLAVARIDAFVAAYNQAIDSLTRAGVDPQVRSLTDDYLPLHYACPRDQRRERLRHERRGGDHFAVASCHCGAEFRFWMGSGSISLDEVMADGRWSTDVTFALYLGDYVSGILAGQSSALYGLVLAEVARTVLDREPRPTLLPPELASGLEPGESNSLLYDYLAS